MSAPPLRSGEVIWLTQRQVRAGFTARDLEDLAQWASQTRRLALWDSDTGSFAMLYADRSPWASWAVTREDGMVRLWNSITLADVGRFPCMCDALAAIPSNTELAEVVSYNVLPFRAA